MGRVGRRDGFLEARAMVDWFKKKRCGAIGVDIGSRTVRLVQLDPGNGRLVEAVRWDISHDPDEGPVEDDKIVETIRRARDGRRFRGRDAVICLDGGQLFVQNVRVPKGTPEDLQKLAYQEAAGRITYPINEAEVRFLNAGETRVGETRSRELILMACHRVELNRQLDLVTRAGLRPVAVDIEPAALLRCYVRQSRREEDRGKRIMFVHMGTRWSTVVIGEKQHALFVKYLNIGGLHLDAAVSSHLGIGRSEAAALRLRQGERRADSRDPEVDQSIHESIQPTLDRLASELAMCLRYHGVAFRGRSVAQVVVGGSEATAELVTSLHEQLHMPCELCDPLRDYENGTVTGRCSQWDVATGLALRNTN